MLGISVRISTKIENFDCGISCGDASFVSMTSLRIVGMLKNVIDRWGISVRISTKIANFDCGISYGDASFVSMTSLRKYLVDFFYRQHSVS